MLPILKKKIDILSALFGNKEKRNLGTDWLQNQLNELELLIAGGHNVN